MTLISSSCSRVVVGLGKTGLSCVRYLAGQGLPFSVVDSRTSPPGLDKLKNDYPEIPVFLGGLDSELLSTADELIVSPGIALAQPEIAKAIATGANAIGDIEIFCRAVAGKPVIAITGSNGKSTVTSLLGEMARQAGINVGVGGNIGTPALDLLDKDADLYILELSSFQLETTATLRAAAATVLNITPDHMDRYKSLADYHAAKQRIYKGCRAAIYNLDDPLSAPLLPASASCSGFTAGQPDLGQFGLRVENGKTWLCKGLDRLMDTSLMKMCGRHNFTNALAALGLGEAVNLPLDPMLKAVCQFPGLPYRCQWLADIHGVRWFNDSKATNTGASIAAIEGLGEQLAGHVVLIAGGEGKDADFTELKPSVREHVSHLILLGRDAGLMAEALGECAEITHVDSLHEAVRVAYGVSRQGDVVLLAPACASFDMFKSFEDRGEQFSHCVYELLQRHKSCR